MAGAYIELYFSINNYDALYVEKWLKIIKIILGNQLTIANRSDIINTGTFCAYCSKKRLRKEDIL